MAIYTNQAILTYNEGKTTLSNVAVGELTEPVAVTKTAVNNDYIYGDDVTYVITITNSGPSAITSLTVTDNFGAYPYGPIPITVFPLTYVGPVLYYVNGVRQADIVPTQTYPTLILTVPSVPVGGNVTLIYEVDVNQYAPLGAASQIDNVVTVTAAGLATITATETIYTEDIPQLAITKYISPNPVVNNSTVTYTFILENYGNTASTDVVLSDTFDPILTGITVSNDGTLLSPVTEYTYSELSGILETVAGVLTIPAATFDQDALGIVTVTPGATTVVVTGTI
jgi:uncharacterized repeat protein (TIGR01451 family)